MAELTCVPNDVLQKLLQGITCAPDGMILVDLQGIILYLNPAASRLTGWPASEALGRDARTVFQVVNTVNREVAWNPLSQVLSDQQSYSLFPNSVLISRDGREIPIEDTISPFQDELGAFAGAVILFRDVSLSRWHLVKALHRAQHDPLTSLPNRATLHAQILSALSSLGSKSRALCLLFIDIDGFKSVNDTLGHAAGDFVLQVLAERIAACLRGTDLVCRAGGDEFVVLLPVAGGVRDLQCVIDELLAAAREPIDVLGSAAAISFSIGVALRREQSSDVAGFLADADAAAYRAKAAGGDRAQLFETPFRQEISSGRFLQHELMEALRSEQFILQYQPIVDCRTGRMAGAEALVRWKHPDGNLLHPVSFISAAERSGLMVQLGRQVLKQALTQRKLWIRNGYRAFQLSVNVSAVEILSGEYVESLRELLAASDYESESLILELTESALLGAEQQRLLIPAIRALKVQVAMDDFGIGYSNVDYLRSFAVDTIKIDKSFVSGIPHRGQDASMVKAMIAMAASVHASTTAEGVETADQARFLCQAGCCHAQGRYYSPPVFPEAIGALLEAAWTVPAA